MLKSNALYDWLFKAGWNPELVEEDTEIILTCPLCGDTRPRLYISTDSGAWHDFHCGEEGGLHRLMTAVCGERASDAHDLVTQFRTAEDDVDYFQKADLPREDKVATLALPPSYNPIGPETPEIFLAYLRKRHVSPELAAARGLGYAISGRYGWRIIVPVQNDGHLYTFIGRTVQTQCPHCTEKLDDCICQPFKFPKVLTPTQKHGSRPRLTLYNYDAVRRAHPASPVVVEGVFDALRLPNKAVALMGSSASATQIALLAALARGGSITLCLDADSAGYHGMLKIAEALSAELVTVKIALLPEGEDPSSVDDQTLIDALDNAHLFVL